MAASALACAAVTLGLRRGAIATGVEDLPKVSHQIRKKEVHSLPYREGIGGTKERTDLGSGLEDVKVGYKGKWEKAQGVKLGATRHNNRG
ncbi:hypothetical protein V496_03439 [Pseudogymnoascus sp. VKM F-4515 (FW-2607)]|nr:hypothetical protein V496_03439 [Pseudogymnoascus sp. VKM F-4515 (FW-2607)]